jgi:hypothetical protein
MQIKGGDIAIATHGRGFWILDDISVFQQMADAPDRTHLFKPRDAYRYRPLRDVPALASPAPYGVFVNYNLEKPAQSIELRFKEADGKIIRTFKDVPNKAGLNRFIWTNQRYPGSEELEGHPTRASRNIGPYALPGNYQVELVADGASFTQSFSLVKDPNSLASSQDLQEQFEFVSDVRDTITHINQTVLAIRDIRASILDRAEASSDLANRVENMNDKLYRLEDVLTAYTAVYRMEYHAKATKLDDKLYNLAGHALRGDARPTKAQKELFEEHKATYNTVRNGVRRFLEKDLVAFNAAAKSAGLETVTIPAHFGPGFNSPL